MMLRQFQKENLYKLPGTAENMLTRDNKGPGAAGHPPQQQGPPSPWILLANVCCLPLREGWDHNSLPAGGAKSLSQAIVHRPAPGLLRWVPLLP